MYLLYFHHFHLDPAAGQLRRGDQTLKLTAKAFAVLHYLATHPQTLVSKTELFTAVWPGVVVSDWALSTCVREIRRVLGDTAKTPQIIETVYRRGYRFLPAVTTSQGSGARGQGSDPSFHPIPDSRLPTPTFVGREAELARLHTLLDKAVDGERQLVFVTGEPGIGKTALLEVFVSCVRCPASQEEEENQKSKGKNQKAKIEDPTPSTRHLAPAFVAQGQCIEQYGAREAYLPVLEALQRLGRTEAGLSLKAVLEQYAPTWLLHLPGLVTADEAAALQPRVFGATRERMLRELAEALEVLTTEQPLVLVLEDLHWADASTIELLAMLGRRRDAARLLVIGTYRPGEVLGNGHPLNSMVRELHTHQRCREVALPLLSEADLQIYLQHRFPHTVFPTRLAKVLHRHTEGNPLFAVSMLNDFIAQGMIAQESESWDRAGTVDRLTTGVPESLRHLVVRQRERLSPEVQQVLAAASMAGMEFSVAAVAAALEAEVVTIGAQCARLAEQQQFLRPAGIAEWPDGTVAARYGFMHAVYQQLWREQVNIEQQQQWHLRIGERKELAYGAQVSEIASELALHFEQGRTYPRAIHYLQQAIKNALRRSANDEVITHLTRALVLLQPLPRTFP